MTPDDPRGRGFRSRASVEEVSAWVDALPAPLPAERISLARAAGRVLAEIVASEVSVPAFRRASMDGWALRAEDTFGASPSDPVSLRVVGVALPGRRCEREVAPREAVRITTGAPVPEGADAVLPAEEGEESGGSLEARGAVTPGRHVGAAGEDVRAGSTVLAVGRRLRPQDLGLLSSIGRAAVAVVRRPRVQIIVTGSEVLPAGRPAEGPRVPDANGPMLEALVTRDGGEPVSGPPVPDDPDAIGAALDASDEEVVLVSGGSSVGEEDHVPSVLARRGVLAFHGVSMRPSSPTGAGTIRGRPVFLLPGNPVSCLCAYDFFAGRAIRRLGGRPAEWPYRAARLPLARKIASALGRTDFVRVRVEGGRIEPLMTRGAGILSSAVEADGFVVVPRDSEGYAPGTVVEAFLYDS